MLHVYFLHCILSFFFGLAFSVFAPLSLCLPFAIYFLATTRFNSKTSNLFPYLSSHCWSKNIEHILSFIHAPSSSFSFFSHSLSFHLIVPMRRQRHRCTQHNYHNFAYSASSGTLRPRPAYPTDRPSLSLSCPTVPLSQCTAHSRSSSSYRLRLR